jgi:hypothetical protein
MVPASAVVKDIVPSIFSFELLFPELTGDVSPASGQ